VSVSNTNYNLYSFHSYYKYGTRKSRMQVNHQKIEKLIQKTTQCLKSKQAARTQEQNHYATKKNKMTMQF